MKTLLKLAAHGRYISSSSIDRVCMPPGNPGKPWILILVPKNPLRKIVLYILNTPGKLLEMVQKKTLDFLNYESL